MVSVESGSVGWLVGWGLSLDGACGWVAGCKQGKRRRRPQKLT